ncbi:MAG: phosphatase PAP2 family protein [Parvibaculum sp.]|uniref:phosphatase PAP2 family protein n=1 Tax=Parvibaculum sp. TaxID=2024848 RepID=UPI0028436C64|nr:phosphatase PAP2 family protein [Parvibaculum sp.]MDR3497957.1 phosphatase PAP2 family protein [Parvibaculum sp.]
MRFSPAALLAVALLLAPTALAAKDLAPSDGIALDLEKVLPCPPQSNVAAGAGFTCAQAPALEKRDYQAVLDAQKNATPEEKTLAIADAARPSVAQFGRPLWQQIAGPACKIAPDIAAAKDDKELADKLPATVAVFKAMTKESIRTSGGAKKVYNRLRPFDTVIEGMPRIVPLLPVDNLKDSPSYPSGHTAFAYEAALILSNLVPEEQDLIYARAAQYGHNRLVVGVHYPSDVEQGRVSGELIAGAFLQKDDFRALLEKARPEIRKTLCR